MLKLLLAATVAMLTPAMSGPTVPMQSTGPRPYLPTAAMVPVPPLDLQGAPDQPVIILFGNPAEVDAACRNPGQVGGTVFACTFGRERVQIMPNPCLYENEAYARIQCHENGHLARRDGRRWGSDHRGSVRL